MDILPQQPAVSDTQCVRADLASVIVTTSPGAVTVSWQHSYISKITYKLKLGHTDLVFGLWSEIISRYVHAGLLHVYMPLSQVNLLVEGHHYQVLYLENWTRS